MFRILLGLALMVKGFIFIANTSALQQIIAMNFGIVNTAFLYLIAFTHLLTGFLILIGLATRISCLIQIPNLLVAVFFINSRAGVGNAEFLFSLLVLLLLCFFLFMGSGRFSAYFYVANSLSSRKADESGNEVVGSQLNSPMDKEGNLR